MAQSLTRNVVQPTLDHHQHTSASYSVSNRSCVRQITLNQSAIVPALVAQQRSLNSWCLSHTPRTQSLQSCRSTLHSHARQQEGLDSVARQRNWQPRQLTLHTHALLSDVRCAATSSKVQERNLNLNGNENERQTIAADVEADEQQPESSLSITIRQATSPQLLRAAAELRSLCFYDYPTDRSPLAVRQHRQMKAEAEWQSLRRKVGGDDPGFPKLVCLVATISLRHSQDSTQPSSTSNEEEEEDDDICTFLDENGKKLSIVGTLDVSLGKTLPGEELIGDLPPGFVGAQRRAYLSNVCVAALSRRKGVAENLIREAEMVASSSWGVEELYVHVIDRNHAAGNLYRKCGYIFEKEESPVTARLLDRPRRLLLHRNISVPRQI